MLHFYILMNYKKEKSGNSPIYNCIKKKKLPKDKFNQRGEALYIENQKSLMKAVEHDTSGDIFWIGGNQYY